MQEPEIDVALLTGGADKPYAFGLSKALVGRGLRVDLVAGSELDLRQLRAEPGLNFLNLRGDQRSTVSVLRKMARVTAYYGRLIQDAAVARPRVFHILWNNKFETFDRTLLMWYYRLLGKRVVLTAHNVNAGRRDGTDHWLNRWTLKAQYRLSEHIFVHTERMKTELVRDFGVSDATVTVIPFGINNSVPDTDLTPAQARERLGIGLRERTILFFGSIAPYKGLGHLVDAFNTLAPLSTDYRLLIVGAAKKGCGEYLVQC